MCQSLRMRLLLFIFFLATSNNLFAQKNIFKRLFSDQPDTTRSNSFLPIPIVAYAQETGLVFGATGLYSFYTDRQDKNNRNSTISIDLDYSTEKQATAFVKTDIWGLNNKYHYVSDIRYKFFPFYFYGIGNQTQEANKDLVLERMQDILLTIEKKTGSIFYTGIDVAFNNYAFEAKEPNRTFDTYPSLQGRNGGKALFIGLSQNIDSRNSNVYATKGTYLKIGFSYCPNFFGGANFEGTFLKCDFRSFKSIASKLVLGINANYQSIQGASIPFYLLPQLGSETIMRGYYTGRYRDQNLLAAQAELRYRFIPRLGIVGFIGVGSVYDNGGFKITDNKPSFGTGLRYFFEVERGLSISVDYGWGEKRPSENRQQGLYVSIGQSF